MSNTNAACTIIDLPISGLEPGPVIRRASCEDAAPTTHKESRSTDVVDRLHNVSLTLFFSDRMASPPGLEPEPIR